MTEQTPEPAPDEAVQPEKTTNDLTKQDDVWVDVDQDPTPQPDLGHTFVPDDEAGLTTSRPVDGAL